MAAVQNDVNIITFQRDRSSPFKSLWFYTIVASITALLTSAMWTYMYSVQSTIQTVYSFSATNVGVWYAMFEVGGVTSNILASYYFTNKHIPRVIGIGTCMTILSCLMHGVPHFLIDYGGKIKSFGDKTTSADDLIMQSVCENNVTGSFATNASANPIDPSEASDLAEKMSTQSMIVLIFYCIAGCLNGAGYAPSYSLGLSYIDNNADEKHGSSKYLGILLASYSLGPILGFGSGSLFLSYYVNFKETYLTPDDNDWIGAWWIGFFMYATTLLPCAILLSLFPKSIKAPAFTNRTPEKYTDENNSSGSSLDILEESDANLKKTETKPEQEKQKSVKGLFLSLWRLLTNPLYMLAMTASCAGCYFAAGWMGLLPKYFQEQFHVSAWMSSIYGGALPPIISVPAILICGYLTSKYKLTFKQDAAFIFFSVSITTILLVPLLFVGCRQYPAQEAPLNLSSCTSYCKCDPAEFLPVCKDGITYKSPCQIGCSSYHYNQEDIAYDGCFCEEKALAYKGVCFDEDCYAKYVYLVLSVISMCTLLSSVTSGATIIMHTVTSEDKSLAIGLQSAMNSLTGWIPAPVLYGYLIDETCTVWEYPEGSPENPDWKGYCKEYDNAGYRHRFVGITVATMAISSLLCGLAWRAAHFHRYRHIEQEQTSSAEDEKPDDP